MSATVPRAGGASGASPSPTSGLTVVGWLLVCFGSLPLLFGFHEGSTASLVVGAVAAGSGVLAVLVGRARSARR